MRAEASRRVCLPIAFATVVAALSFGNARADSVPNSVQQVFHSGSVATPSRAIDGYAGELLALQAVDVGMTAAEPTIGVAVDGTAYFAAATLDVETSVEWGVSETHTLRSIDGGHSWERVQLGVPNTTVSIPPANLDPYVWLDQATSRVFNIDMLGACSWLNYSDNRGASWTSNPAACGVAGMNDHQTIVGANPRGATTTGYPEALYYCVNGLVRAGCGRSLNGGDVWTPVGDAYFEGQGCDFITGHLAADPDGRIFLPSRCNGHPAIAISGDGGTTWSQVEVNTMHSEYTHTSVASDAAGNLYYTWISAVGTPPRVLPFVSVSRDHGRTWGPPMMVAPPGVKSANFPVIAAGDDGHIALNFPGVTATGSSAKWNEYVVVSADALSADPVFLSATANDPATDPVHRGACLGRCGGMWDYLDVTVSPAGEVWATAADDCTSDCDQGTVRADHVGRGIAIRQIGGPRLRAG